MADKNIWDPNPPQEQEVQPNNDNNNTPNIQVVGINILVLAGYTFICALLREVGPLLDSLLLLIHVVTCFVIAVTKGKGVWGLSGLVVLLIGVSTCVGILWKAL